MKVLVYYNKEKDAGGVCKTKLIEGLEKHGVDYSILEDDMLSTPITADALFAIGGDGTILFLAEFANKNSIPIIGINAGNLGFLCEFEKSEVETAILGLKNGTLIKDYRTMLSVAYNNDVFYALNEVYVQRTYDKSVGNTVAEIQIEIDNSFVSKYSGDGTIISSPTGSTAYSFSLGAPISSPYANVFTMTPIAAHAFNQRPIVYSDDSVCCIRVSGKAQVGVFVDGRLVEDLKQNDCITISKVDKKLLFLRKKEYNFFKKLRYKLNRSAGVLEND